MSRMSQIEGVRTDESNVNDKKLKLDSGAVSSRTDSMETGRNVDDTKLSSELVNSDITASSEAALEDGQGIGSSDWTSGSDHIEQKVNDGPDMDALERLRSGQTYDAQEEYYDNDDYWEAQTTAYNKAKEKYEFFWHSDSIYSQWHISGFRVDGRWFRCAEQYMMYGKAVTFKDFKTARKILDSKDPKKMKALGREVQNFKPFKWQCFCLYIVKEGNMAKFSQNEGLKEAILATYPKVLVEASPKDKIWGIGRAEEDPLAWNEDSWDGTNYLGYVLTEVRDELIEVPEEQRVNYIHKLLREANMSDEMIQEIQPNDWKPTPEEERELNGEYRGKKHKENQDKQHGRGGRHSGPGNNNDDDGARRREEHGHGETHRHPSGPQGGEERNNRALDSNWRSGPRKEAGRDKWENGRGKNYQDKQQRDVDHSERDQYEYFWGQKNFYSQFYPTEFEVDNEWFNCAEQYMMYMKARVFRDDEIAREILRTEDPTKIKGLGRKVRNFDDDVWQKESLHLVKKGNIAKFSQNDKLKRVIMRTHPKILVEASPHDKIWGIGLDKDDERAWRKATWQGTNFLGYILTEVRDEIMAREKKIEEKERKVYLPDLQKQYAEALKNRYISRDNTGGWAKHNQGGQDGQYLSGSQRPGVGDDNNKTSRDASSTTEARPAIPGANFVEDNKSKKRKNKKKNKGQEENQGKKEDWWEMNNDNDFQVPDAALASEQKLNSNEAQTKQTENLKVKSTTPQVQGENNNEGEELQTTEGKGQKKSVEKKEDRKSDDGWETAKGKKGRRQGSPEKSEVQASEGKGSSNANLISKDHTVVNLEAVPNTNINEHGSHSPDKEETKKKKKEANPDGLSRRQRKNKNRK